MAKDKKRQQRNHLKRRRYRRKKQLKREAHDLTSTIEPAEIENPGDEILDATKPKRGYMPNPAPVLLNVKARHMERYLALLHRMGRG